MEHCKTCKCNTPKTRKNRPFKHPPIDGQKICTRCNINKDIVDYNKSSGGSLKSMCKACQKIINADYYKRKTS